MSRFIRGALGQVAPPLPFTGPTAQPMLHSSVDNHGPEIISPRHQLLHHEALIVRHVSPNDQRHPVTTTRAALLEHHLYCTHRSVGEMGSWMRNPSITQQSDCRPFVACGPVRIGIVEHHCSAITQHSSAFNVERTAAT